MNTNKSHEKNYGNEEVSRSKAPAALENQVSFHFQILSVALKTRFVEVNQLQSLQKKVQCCIVLLMILHYVNCSKQNFDF